MTGEHRTNGETPGAAPIRRLDEHAAPWPRLSVEQARLARLLKDARLPRALGVDEFDATKMHAPRWRNTGAIEFECDDSYATAFVDLDAFPALKIAASGASGNVEYAEEQLSLAVAHLLLNGLLRELVKCGLANVRVSRLRQVPHNELNRSVFRLTLAVDGRRMQCLLGDIGERWLGIFEQRVAQAPLAGLGALATLNVPSRLRLGTLACSIELLKTLRSGDVLLPDMATGARSLLAAPGAAITLSARWGTESARALTATVSILGDVMTFLETPHMTDEIDQSPGDMADHENVVELEQLELPVQFELDTVSLPVALLASLRPGYVVELPNAVRDARVRLAAYGQTIGYGELVTVGEHLAVRIVQLADLHDSVQ